MESSRDEIRSPELSPPPLSVSPIRLHSASPGSRDEIVVAGSRSGSPVKRVVQEVDPDLGSPQAPKKRLRITSYTREQSIGKEK